MCGICGVIGLKDPIQKRLLALLNESRGRDSVGFWSDSRVCRIPESISEAILKNRIPDYIWDGNVWLCHTRAASTGVGGVSKDNTHPFTYGNFTGAHNGCLHNWRDIKDKYKQEYPGVVKFDVDSQVIPFLLEIKGPEGLKEVGGWAACWWVDRREPNKVFLWNQRGDIAITKANGQFVAFSSNADHLRLAQCGNKKDIMELKENGQLIAIDTLKMTYGKIGEYQGKSEVTVIHQMAGAADWQSGYWNRGAAHYDKSGITSDYLSTMVGELVDKHKLKALTAIINDTMTSVKYCSICHDFVVDKEIAGDCLLFTTPKVCPECHNSLSDLDNKLSRLTTLQALYPQFVTAEDFDTEKLEKESSKKIPPQRSHTPVTGFARLNLARRRMTSQQAVRWCKTCEDFVFIEDYAGKAAIVDGVLACATCGGSTTYLQQEETLVKINKLREKIAVVIKGGLDARYSDI